MTPENMHEMAFEQLTDLTFGQLENLLKSIKPNIVPEVEFIKHSLLLGDQKPITTGNG